MYNVIIQRAWTPLQVGVGVGGGGAGGHEANTGGETTSAHFGVLQKSKVIKDSGASICLRVDCICYIP